MDNLSSLWTTVSNLFSPSTASNIGNASGDVDAGYWDNQSSNYLTNYNYPSSPSSSSGANGGFNWGNVFNFAQQAAPLALLAMGNGGGQQTTNTYQTPIYPNTQALQSNKNMGIANAGAARSAAYDDLARQLSVRGIGPNSPYSAGKGSGIERAYQNALAGIDNTYTNKAYTPIGFNQSSTTTGGGNNGLAMALGLMMSQNNKNNLFKLFGG